MFGDLWERKGAGRATGLGDQAAPNPTIPMVLLQLGTISLASVKILRLGMSWRNKLSLPADLGLWSLGHIWQEGGFGTPVWLGLLLP